MNCKEANRIPITDYLLSQGINPKEIKNGHAWYCSPFRPESVPSFKVNTNLNQWYDFGTGENGSLVDLVARLIGSDISGALIHLQRPDLKPAVFSFGQQKPAEQRQGIKIIGFRELLSIKLIQYVLSRRISIKIATCYLKEVYHTINNKNRNYFSLGLQNDREGWELRSLVFKGSSSPKWITTIPGDTEQLNIFEGMFDFLSCLEHYRTTRLKNQTIILNSLVHIKQIDLNSFQVVNLFLDNDPAGRQATKNIKSIHHQVNDYSQIIYPDHKDFNEYLCSQVLFK